MAAARVRRCAHGQFGHRSGCSVRSAAARSFNFFLYREMGGKGCAVRFCFYVYNFHAMCKKGEGKHRKKRTPLAQEKIMSAQDGGNSLQGHIHHRARITRHWTALQRCCTRTDPAGTCCHTGSTAPFYRPPPRCRRPSLPGARPSSRRPRGGRPFRPAIATSPPAATAPGHVLFWSMMR